MIYTNMANQFIKMKRRIMRRVYYIYTMRMMTHPLVTHGVLVMGAFIALTHVVSLPHVLANMGHIPLENISQFLLNAFTHTQVWTYILLGVMCFGLISLRWQLRNFRWTTFDTAAYF